MKNKILVAIGVIMSVGFLHSCGNKSSNTTNNKKDHAMSDMAKTDSVNSNSMTMDNDMMQSMSSSMDKMKDMKMTGDFDADFASMMIMHHQVAIDMSEVEVEKGTDAQIKTMAQTIISAQKAEIEKLKQFEKSDNGTDSANKNDEKMHDELGETMRAMMDKMHAMQMTGSTDKDFVMMMIPHHESSITMAENEIEHGKQPELKKMANNMIAEHNKEIAAFKAWQAEQK